MKFPPQLKAVYVRGPHAAPPCRSSDNIPPGYVVLRSDRGATVYTKVTE